MRLTIVILGIFIIYSLLVFNLYNLQVEKGRDYLARAESQYRAAGFLEPQRGSIYFIDKNHNLIPAVLNRDYPVIFAVPKEVKNIEETARALSSVLNLDFEKIKEILSKKNDLYELILAKASSAQIEEIKKLNLLGIYIENKNFRYYPFGSLAAHLLGFVGFSSQDDDLRGRYGLERYYDDFLRGSAGRIEGDQIINPVDGRDLVLTVDRNIQAQAERVLSNLIEKFKASGGSVIVEEPATGKILALANYPTFDPNNYSNYPLKNFINPALEYFYEPGSIFKVITMAAGIDSGKISPETEFFDSGSVTLNGRTIKNWDLKAHGQVTMTEVIERSINTGAVFAQRKTGNDIFYNYLLKFGFEELTGISLPGEISGNLSPLKKHSREINFATASFGQGVAVTPIELISAIAAIANDGILMKPIIIDSEKPQVVRRVISKETADKVTAMMVSAVNKAQIAKIFGYEIAGKTGTAYIPDFKNGGYTDQVINTYVGFGPATNPRFIILIKLDKPEGAPIAGLTVVPAFRELAQFILNYYNIPPDDL